MSKILQIDIVLADLLAGYYRYSNANNNDKTLLQVLEVTSTIFNMSYAPYHMKTHIIR